MPQKPTQKLSSAEKKDFRAIGHHLDPVVQISENGISEGALAEIERALNDHELIKIKLMSPERDERADQLDAICTQSKAELVQKIGKMALLYRHNPNARERLSNVRRFAGN